MSSVTLGLPLMSEHVENCDRMCNLLGVLLGSLEWWSGSKHGAIVGLSLELELHGERIQILSLILGVDSLEAILGGCGALSGNSRGSLDGSRGWDTGCSVLKDSSVAGLAKLLNVLTRDATKSVCIPQCDERDVG